MKELDALVGTKVMAWSKEDAESMWVIDGWSPSTDMNAAMEVFLSRKELTTIVKANSLDGPVFGVFVLGAFSKRDDPEEHDAYVWHKSLPTAICLAALAAVGVEYKESKDE